MSDQIYSTIETTREDPRPCIAFGAVVATWKPGEWTAYINIEEDIRTPTGHGSTPAQAMAAFDIAWGKESGEHRWGDGV